MEHQATTLNCRGRLVDLSSPLVMGILNLTPDSFFDGGKHSGVDAALRQCATMLEEGAAIIDLGGMSSRPGAEIISVDEELRRVLPVLEALLKEFPEVLVSLDTVRSEVARAGLERGVHIINDISASKIDPQLWKVVAEYQVPYILMHMQGIPENMQDRPEYQDVLEEVFDFFSWKLEALRKLGVKDVILDPGFGFGKRLEDNYRLLAQMAVFSRLERPLLAGISRKSMICKALKVNPSGALNGTTALHVAALQQGARILRVHDVKEAVETIKLWQYLGQNA